MQLIFEKFNNVGKVINDGTVILKLEKIKWYKSDLRYEYDDSKSQLVKADFFGRKFNLLQNKNCFGEIVRGNKSLFSWNRDFKLSFKNSDNIFYLKRSTEWFKINRSYQLLNTINSKVELTINVNYVNWKEVITVDYDSTQPNIDLLLFSVFTFQVHRTETRAAFYFISYYLAKELF
tara:strand:- start:84 stop:614 length:531 start_codon:yes stop_codon:yes gene_type:complete